MAVDVGNTQTVLGLFEVHRCREIERFDPDLTLKGLRVLYEMNS
jgi:pantothenate kinase type III